MNATDTKSGHRNLNFLFIIGLILAILTMIFAIQNSADTDVKFFSFILRIPTALLIFGGILVGAVLTLLFSLPRWLRNRKEKSHLHAELKELRKNYDELAAIQPNKGRAGTPKAK